MIWTEDMICDHLKVTFTTFDTEGRVKVVYRDAPPPPRAENTGGRKPGTKVRQAFWTPEDRATLEQCLARRMPVEEIAWLLSRSLDSVKSYLKVKRAAGELAA